jgi:hypothetical protein
VFFAEGWDDDPRLEPPATGDEATILLGHLEWHLATFELKFAGLTPAQMSTRSVPPSRLSLHGLARHLAGVERWWGGIQLAGENVPLLS